MNDAHVLDASAILCLFFKEKGADTVETLLEKSIMSAVNLAEAVSKLHERNVAQEKINMILANFSVPIIAFDQQQSIATAALRNATRSSGLSLGDRACLALAASRNATAVTTDKAWSNFETIARVLVVR
jgi:ribonuclease VapC